MRARRLCPDLLFVKPRFAAYKEASQQVREVFKRYSDSIEPLSLDEAYLDVTTPLRGPPSATLVARAILDEIFRETGLTASAGVAGNKFLAKIGSGLNKPAGLTVILPEEAEAFIAQLKVERFHGVGPATARRLKKIGIHTGADLRARPRAYLVQHFGKTGHWFYKIARGIDNRPVSARRARKSVGAERTFAEDIRDPKAVKERLDKTASEVWRRMEKQPLSGRTVTIKLKYHDFVVVTRRKTHTANFGSAEELRLAVARLFEAKPLERAVRLVGVSVSNLTPANELLSQLAFDLSQGTEAGSNPPQIPPDAI